jgi:hypothetical protein
VSPGVAVIWRLLCTLMEVLVFVGLGGALTLWLVPYVESVLEPMWRIFVGALKRVLVHEAA